jgi:hypothetical protein
MTALTKIDREAARQLSMATEAALQEVAEEYGLTVALKGGTFDPAGGTYRPKVEFSMADSGERKFANECELVGYTVNGQWHSLKAEDYGAEFTSHGRTFTLTGVNLRAPKFPIQAKGDDGKSYKFPEAILRTIIANRVQA